MRIGQFEGRWMMPMCLNSDNKKTMPLYAVEGLKKAKLVVGIRNLDILGSRGGLAKF